MEELKKISDIILHYGDNGSSDSIDSLLQQRDELATLSFRLAEISSNSKRDYNGAYFIRKVNIARNIQELQKQGMSYNKADAESLIKNEKFYRNEILKEAEAYKMDLLLKQCNKVLDAMSQRISYMKQDAMKYENKTAY